MRCGSLGCEEPSCRCGSKVPTDHGKCPLPAVGPLRELAARPDERHRGLGARVEPPTVDKTTRVAEIAAERHGELLPLRAEPARPLLDGARDPQIAPPIRHLGYVLQHLTGT